MYRTGMFFSITILLGLVSIYLFPYYTVNPGVLVRGHDGLRNNCFACHVVGSGPTTEKCLDCHNISEVGIKTVEGLTLQFQNPKTNLLHKSINNIECYYCHTEHNGLSKENAILNFRHNVLPVQLINDCVSCHREKLPIDKIHNRISENCVSCHTTETWTAAVFKHELITSNKNDCESCHFTNIPKDDFHAGLTSKILCVKCHTTSGWKPSTFEHSEYFRFDKHHPSDCSKCHDVQKSFEFYTCYNCHEHQPARIAEKHRKEGISDFINCVKCHRSGDEDEAKGKNRNEREKKKREKHDDD
ncbi:MAG: hypothetical protein Q8N03_02040 [Ignavibacteria bacterium]|nr:hypothetical protein [Ignavibacteria bacterium]